MAKVLRDTELLDIVRRIVEEGVIDEICPYTNFVDDLGKLITDYCGGEVGNVIWKDGEGTVAEFHVNDSVPADGGVYSKYDTDITWKDGEEVG